MPPLGPGVARYAPGMLTFERVIALVAVVGSFLSPLLLQRLQAGRETRARLHDDRRRIYTEAAALTEFHRVAVANAQMDVMPANGPLDLGGSPSPPPRPWSIVGAEVQFIGGRAVRVAAEFAGRLALFELVSRNVARLPPDTGRRSPELGDAAQIMRSSSQELDETMRVELGVDDHRDSRSVRAVEQGANARRLDEMRRSGNR